jgi:hypothetical protein
MVKTKRNSMTCAVLLLTLLALEAVWALPAAAQDKSDESVACSFADGKEVSIRYRAVSSKEPLPKTGVWTPGKAPLYLFLQTSVSLGTTTIPLGAYSIYVDPDKKQWTLIVNRNVEPGSQYDEKQDLVRVPMDTASVSSPVDRLQVALGATGAKQCSLRFYFGKTAAYGADFLEQ